MKIYSIFKSIDGEVNHFHQGRISTFIRFSGCNLRPFCTYCDTKYALKKDSGKKMNVDQIIKEVKKLGCKKVTITGGEPLMQFDGFLELTIALWHNGCFVSVETNGSYILNGINIGSWIVDYKLKSSGVCETKMIPYSEFCKLNYHDFIKFVISDRDDYCQAITVMKTLRKVGCIANFAFSPAHSSLNPLTLMKWLDEDKINDVIINLQFHKYLGLVEDQEN